MARVELTTGDHKQQTVFAEVCKQYSVRLTWSEELDGYIANWVDSRGRNRTTIFSLCLTEEGQVASVAFAERDPIFKGWASGTILRRNIVSAINFYLLSWG